MEVSSMPFLLVTANVGSVFEDPSKLLKQWIKEFLSKVALLRPQFLALHLQEVGGKTYEKSMEYVQDFIKHLCESEELTEYNRIRIYLDEDYNSAEHFTALGNIYFIHQSLSTVKIWNFLTHEWEIAEGKSIHTGNIEAIATKEKAKFPQHFFPECKWSRKGFLRTRWELNYTVVDLVNIHLFHDASNLAACEEFPSVYCKTRRRALVHTLERFHTDMKNGLAPYFLFGDFNFRCDTEGVIRKLTEDLTAHRIQNAKNDNTKVHYRNSMGENILTVGKKEFTHTDHQTKFKESWLQQFDRELEPLREVLVEYPITFPPSYPYEEDPDMPKNYMSTRCPAWCDRIVMSPSARDLIVDEAFSSDDYNIIGENICMGDHKPVFLSVHVKTLQGTIRCCSCQEHVKPPHITDLNLMSVEKHVNVIQNYDDGDDAVENIINKINIVNNIDDNNDIDIKSSITSTAAAANTATITTLSPPHYCLYSSNEFNSILVECRKLDKNKLLNSNQSSDENDVSSNVIKQGNNNILNNNNNNNNICTKSNNNNNNNNNSTIKPTAGRTNSIPLVSINITDTDNYDVCMCPMYYDEDDYCDNSGSGNVNANDNDENNDTNSNFNKICPECRNIIKKQPTEHRCTLISKRLLLTNNIIVNRIDTHYLNTSYIDNRFEPYTPESVESHSPVPDPDYENSSNSLNINSISSTTSSQSNLPNNNNSSSNINNSNNNNNNLNINTNNSSSLSFPSSRYLTVTDKSANIQNSSGTTMLMSSSSLLSSSNSALTAASSANANKTNLSRGIVSPKQLKSRLENLQRSTLNKIEIENREIDKSNEDYSGAVVTDNDENDGDDENSDREDSTAHNNSIENNDTTETNIKTVMIMGDKKRDGNDDTNDLDRNDNENDSDNEKEINNKRKISKLNCRCGKICCVIS